MSPNCIEREKRYIGQSLIANVHRCRPSQRRRRQVKRPIPPIQMDIRGSFPVIIYSHAGQEVHQIQLLTISNMLLIFLVLLNMFVAYSILLDICASEGIVGSIHSSCRLSLISRYSSRIKDESPPLSRASGRLSRYKLTHSISSQRLQIDSVYTRAVEAYF